MSIKIMSMVWEASNATLSPTEKSILLRLADFAANDGTSIYPSWKRIENDTGFSRRCIAANLVTLQEKKVLIKIREANKEKHLSCVYRIDVPLLDSWKSLDADDDDLDESWQHVHHPSAPDAPPPSAPDAPYPSLNNQYNKYDFKKNDSEENSQGETLTKDQELDEATITIGEECGLLSGAIQIQFRKFKDYNSQKGNVLTNWHAKWRSWCQRAIQYKPELKYVPSPTAGEKKYGKIPVPKGFTQNYIGIDDRDGRQICMVYWDSSVGHWAESNGTIWEFKNYVWIKK